MISDLTCFLVGGAVRDDLMGRPVTDRDWVVIGSSPREMLDLGFQQVGKDFPVFLHPETREEYALARTERKRGRGHKGFDVDASPHITLEDDLHRRDLTINAMARSLDGELVDPFGGVGDIEKRALRHVSPAFAEDPLRVFRVARFAAQFPEFSVVDETLELMRDIATSGELESLSAERVWMETERALGFEHADRFFVVLGQCGGLDFWFEEFTGRNVGIPEGDFSAAERYALLALATDDLERFGNRLKVPSRYMRIARDYLNYGGLLPVWRSTQAPVLVECLIGLGVHHDLGRFRELADLVSRVVSMDKPGSLDRAAEGLAAIKLPEDAGVSGPAYGAALKAERVAFVSDFLNSVGR